MPPSIDPAVHWACCQVLFEVALFARARSETIDPGQLAELMDAIHNIPVFLQSGISEMQESIEEQMDCYDLNEKTRLLSLKAIYHGAFAEYADRQRTTGNGAEAKSEIKLPSE